MGLYRNFMFCMPRLIHFLNVIFFSSYCSDIKCFFINCIYQCNLKRKTSLLFIFKNRLVNLSCCVRKCLSTISTWLCCIVSSSSSSSSSSFILTWSYVFLTKRKEDYYDLLHYHHNSI